ncbi:MAG TPA: HAD family phosphatase [Candidatus Pullichristensenella avicola]|nr:HAD family phosphatase [Candidatus Pullichristensenella avicola]
MLSSCKYAIFDNDGTLMESMYFWRLGSLEYIIAHRLPIPETMTLRELFSCSSREFTQRLSEQMPNVSYEEVVREMEGRMERHYLFDVQEKPGVQEFLAGLRARGARMCVATAAPRELCRQALARFGILECFDFVTDTYEMEMHKGQKEYFLRVAERLGAPPEACWVFEDAVYAMRAAKAAGMRVCAIEDYTAQAHREEILELADAYIADYRKPPLFDRSGDSRAVRTFDRERATKQPECAQ